MKKLFTLLFALMASYGTLFAESGTCGKNLTWDLTNGVLTISGTGDMYDYDLDIYTGVVNTPWVSQKASITTLIINNGATSIGDWAFYECVGLKSITIPNSVIDIGACTFTGCSGLTSVIIPNGVTTIGAGAFMECTGLTAVTIPNSVTSIEGEAFSYCYSLTSLEVPNSVTSIGNYAFGIVANVVYSGTATGSPWGARSVNGYVYGWLIYSDKSKKNLLACSHAATGVLSVPNSVTSIGDYAFYGCTGLSSLVVPNTVTSIGTNAFWQVVWVGYSGTATGSPWGARSVNGYYEDQLIYSDATKTELVACVPTATGEVIIPNSVTKIEKYAFSNCTGVTSVIIPNSVKSISGRVFDNCTGLNSVTIGSGVTYIGIGAFYGCTSLTSVTIPNSVITIDNMAFENCTNLTSATIGSKVRFISTDAFLNCIGLKTVTINSDSILTSKKSAKDIFGEQVTSYIIGDSATTIGASAFYNCSKMTSITISGSVKSIRSGAFYQSRLDAVHISDLTSWCNISFGDNPLSYAHNLYLNGKLVTHLVIPNDVTSISRYAFNSWNGTSVEIPNSVTSIGDYAFDECTGLTSVTIPNSVTSIGSLSFQNCTALTSVTIGSVTNENGITSIGYGAFKNCSKVTALTMGNNVASIGGSAFSGCTGLKSVTLPNSVISIGEYAFKDCTGLTSMIIPNSVISIDKNTFYSCTGLKSVTIGSGVTSIGIAAFYGCTSLTSVTVPNSVITIDNMAFENCTNLKTVTINSDHIMSKDYTEKTNIKNYFGEQVTSYIIGDSVKSIGDYAFYGCEKLTDITIGDSVTELGSVFKGCTALKSVSLGNSVRKIYYSTFVDCKKLTKINVPDIAVWLNIDFAFGAVEDGYTWPCQYDLYVNNKIVNNLVIPDNVTSISKNTFMYCKSLTSVTIPNSVTSIGEWAFQNCTGLTSLTLGENVTTIERVAFGSCKNLKSLTIPKNVTYIHGMAFSNSTNLTSVTCEAIYPPSMGKYYSMGVFYGVDCSKIPLYVPASSVNSYKTASQWKEFNPILSSNGYTITFVNWDGEKLLVLSDVEEGTVPQYTGETPTRPADQQYSYSFNGWSPEIVAATEDATYTATYSNVLNNYTISANAVHGKVNGTGVYAYGTQITLTVVPDNGYVFDQWSDGIQDNPRTITVIGDAEYTALCVSTEGLDDLSTPENIHKVISNGQLLIRRGDKTYTCQGQEVR